ncbi:hypothetical protein MLD38_005876 [Melastoma candidum]|uniref:Uncharacterized protein n=1 Tax=Melastoma candidum TaxID=119954 RepID=A0ACB9RMA2_9MYRT|nr:hypothetical protein MLD38_005876 [Melastoma candidum]
MVFQDFDHLSERRRAERQQKMRKRIILGVISSLAIAGVIAGAVIGFVSYYGHGGAASASSKGSSPSASGADGVPQLSHSEKAVKMMCQSTDFQDTCKSTLEKAIKKDPSKAQPKDLVKVAVEAAREEIESAFEKLKSFKFESDREKDAFEDCKILVKYALDELELSIDGVSDISKLSKKTHNVNNWLSAVMSYRETCVDGFPDGKTKDDVQKTLQIAKELTSNSLAIISEISSFLSTFQIPNVAPARHLLEDRSSLDDESIPAWINGEDRRILRAKETLKPKPHVTVAKDGSGQFKTINDAVAAIPEKHDGRYIIYVKAGIYDETVLLTKKMTNILIYGDGSQKTIVTGRKNNVEGVTTFKSATFGIDGNDFMAMAMGFRNTAGPEKGQAVALRATSDRAVFLNCRFEGYQDTLYAHAHRQFYRGCVIAGTIDFIFGDATAIFQNCLIVVRRPRDGQGNAVTAQGKTGRHETTGFVLQNCHIIPDKKLVPVKNVINSYLGRPWKEFSTTIVMESNIEDFIHPDGWMAWFGTYALDTLYYAEYNNKGPGAKLDKRVDWKGYKKGFNRQHAIQFTVGPFLESNETWVKETGATVHYGLFE